MIITTRGRVFFFLHILYGQALSPYYLSGFSQNPQEAGIEYDPRLEMRKLSWGWSRHFEGRPRPKLGISGPHSLVSPASSSRTTQQDGERERGLWCLKDPALHIMGSRGGCGQGSSPSFCFNFLGYSVTSGSSTSHPFWFSPAQWGCPGVHVLMASLGGQGSVW